MIRIKKILLSLFIAGAALAALYAYKEYHRTNKDLSATTPDYYVRDTALIDAFLSAEEAATKKYTGRLVAVEGVVKEIGKDEKGHFTIVLGERAGHSSIRCAMDSSHEAAIPSPGTGQVMVLKGLLIGFNRDETGLLGSDVQLTRCVWVAGKDEIRRH